MSQKFFSLFALLLACLLLSIGAAQARGGQADDILETELPLQARETLKLIRQNGPFPHDRDGIVFGNRERALPAKPRGYYHEYTVKTPGTRGRGAKRIVCGGEQSATRDCWYSDNHYQSFKRIR